MIRAHQPGSETIDIPETIPNPVVPKPTPTPTEPAPREPVRIPEKVPLGRRLNGRHLYVWHADSEGEALLVLPQGIAHSPSSLFSPGYRRGHLSKASERLSLQRRRILSTGRS